MQSSSKQLSLSLCLYIMKDMGVNPQYRPYSQLAPIYYMALACGRYYTLSDWLRARSEQSLCSRNAHGPITG